MNEYSQTSNFSTAFFRILTHQTRFNQSYFDGFVNNILTHLCLKSPEQVTRHHNEY